jgi:hypothetical protein
MNPKSLYLAWLRTTSPAVYATAIRQATGRTRTLGGLTGDLVQKAFAPTLRHSFLGDDTATTLDTIDVSAISADQPITTNYTFDTSVPAFDTSSVALPTLTSDTGAVTSTTPAATPTAVAAAGGGPSIFSNILTAVASIGGTVVTASQQSALIALNTQRAAQGLPPVNANGQVVTTAGLAATSPGILAFENAITGGNTALFPFVLIGGVIAAYLLFRK